MMLSQFYNPALPAEDVDLREQMALEASERIEKFSAGSVVRQLENVYRELPA